MLNATLSLNSAPFLDATRRVDSAISGLRGKILTFTAGFAGLSYAFNLLKSQAEGLKDALDLGGAASDLAAQTGASAGDVLILSQALKNAGQGFDSTSAFSARLQKALSGLTDEGKSTAQALKSLGIDGASARKLPLLDQITLLQRGFIGITNAEDRVKLATDLLGKSGASALAFLTDPSALSVARTQMGGLAPIIARNATAFDGLSDALGALDLKSKQFYAGFAEGFSGKLGSIADNLNKLDLSKFGEQMGQLTAAIVQISKVLLQLKPILFALAGQWAFNRLAATGFFTSLSGLGPRLAIMRSEMAVLAAILTKPAYAFRALPIIARSAMLGTAAAVSSGAKAIAAALGPVGLALLAFQGGKAIGDFIGSKISGPDTEVTQVAALNAESDQRQQDVTGFADRRKKLGSEGDRSALLADIDAAINSARERSKDASKNFTGDRLESIQQQIQGTIALLTSQRASVTKAKLLPGENAASEINGVSSLARVGGSGIAGIGSYDPVLTESRRHTKLLETIAAKIGGGTAAPSGNGSSPVPIPV